MLGTLNSAIQHSFQSFREEVDYTLKLANKVFNRLEHSPHGRDAKAELGLIRGHIDSWIMDLEPIAGEDRSIQLMLWQLKNASGQLQDGQRCVVSNQFQVPAADVYYARCKVRDVQRILRGIQQQLVNR